MPCQNFQHGDLCQGTKLDCRERRGVGREGERGDQIYPGLNATEIQIPHGKYHKVPKFLFSLFSALLLLLTSFDSQPP